MAMSRPCASCSADCIKKKVKTRLSWVLVMVLLGTCDMFINWVNFADLTSPELGRGLVLGAPPGHMWILLLAFTIVGTVLYIPETINTISVFFCDSGSNFVPIIYEQLIILPAEQIPLAAINYFISRCRQQYGSTMQTLCGTTSIVFIFTRIVWYAHMEGKLMQRKDDVKMKKGAFMAICALYACSVAFPIMNWRAQPTSKLVEEDQQDVSIFLLKAPMLERRRLSEQRIDAVLRSQARDMRSPYLVKTIADIVSAGDDGVRVNYKCDTNATFLPAECAGSGRLEFRFIYAAFTEAGPYGEIVYNYAFIPSAVATLDQTDSGGSGSSGGGSDTDAIAMTPPCVPSNGDLKHGWKLFYLKYMYKRHAGKKHILVSSPWKETCTTPEAWFDSSIAVCPQDIAREDRIPEVHAETAKLQGENRTYQIVASSGGARSNRAVSGNS